MGNPKKPIMLVLTAWAVIAFFIFTSLFVIDRSTTIELNFLVISSPILVYWAGVFTYMLIQALKIRKE